MNSTMNSIIVALGQPEPALPVPVAVVRLPYSLLLANFGPSSTLEYPFHVEL